LSGEEIVSKVQEAFERAWDRTTEECKDGTFIPINEKDLQFHLACNLKEELREFGWANWVHIEFPIPLEPEKLKDDPFCYGTIIQRGVRRSDIAVVNTKGWPWRIYLIAEVKYIAPKALIGGYLVGLLLEEAMKVLEGKDSKILNSVKKEGLLEEIFERIEREVKWFMRHGEDELVKPVINDLKKVSNLMKVYSDAGMCFSGYVCVMDEIYVSPSGVARSKYYEELIRRWEETFSDVELLYFPFENLAEVLAVTKILVEKALSKLEKTSP